MRENANLTCENEQWIENDTFSNLQGLFRADLFTTNIHWKHSYFIKSQIAQLIRRWGSEPEVAGSSPGAGNFFFNWGWTVVQIELISLNLISKPVSSEVRAAPATQEFRVRALAWEPTKTKTFAWKQLKDFKVWRKSEMEKCGGKVWRKSVAEKCGGKQLELK